MAQFLSACHVYSFTQFVVPYRLKRKLPILGICRGCQIINAALGGTLVQDVPKRFGKVHQMAKGAPSAFDHMVRIVEAHRAAK